MDKPQPALTAPVRDAVAVNAKTINVKAAGESDPLVIRHKSGQSFAPLPTEKCQPFAPPIEDKESSYRRIENRETQSAEAAGVCTRQGAASPPRWERILREDLLQMSRLEQLFIQATRRGCLVPSEANALNFLAAAARATLVGYDPPRLFAGLVRRGLWSNITQAQEELARRSLMRYREAHPDAFRVSDATGVSSGGINPRAGNAPPAGAWHGQSSVQYSTLNVGESSGRCRRLS